MVGLRMAPWVGCLAALALACVRLTAAGVLARLDRDVVELGGSANLQVLVSEAGNVPAPGIGPIEGCQVQYAGSGTQVQIANGRRSDSVSHNYLLTPTREGTVRIPSIEVPVGGSVLRTEPLTLQVTRGLDLSQFGRVELVAPTGHVYVGQSFPVKLRLLFRVSPKDVDVPELGTDGFVVGRRPQMQAGQERVGNEVWGVVTSELALTAARAGELALGPVAWSAVFPMPNRGRGAFNDPFFQSFFGGELRRFRFTSETNRLRVLNPPEAGRPPGFAGAVGRFVMTAGAAPLDVSVGDPVTVRVKVSGEGSLERLNLPGPGEASGFRVYPGTNTFEPGDQLGLSGTKVYEFIYVPQREDLQVIPVPELPFFDPEREEYDVARTRPIPLRVRPAAAGQAEPTVQPNLPTAGAEAPAAPVLAPLRKSLGPVRRETEPWILRPWGVPLAALPMGLAALAGLAGRIRRSRALDPDTRRRRELARRAAAVEASLDAPGLTPSDLREALRDRISLLSGVSPAAVTAGVVSRDLLPRGLDPGVAAEVEALFGWLDAVRYGPGGEQGSVPADERERARRVLQALRSWEASG